MKARYEVIAAELFRRANEAAADAIRFRRDAQGATGLAAARQRDAVNLRKMARAALTA